MLDQVSEPGNEILWGIHAGRTGDAHALFVEKGVIGLGWNEMPDLSTLPATREAFKEALEAVYPDAKAGAVPVQAGQLFRFAHEVQIDDHVAYPAKAERKIYVGRVAGAYFRTLGSGYDHQREVEWLGSFPRTKFSQGALYEIGSALSFFQIKNYADEYFTLLGGGKPVTEVEAEDATVAIVADEIEVITEDFIVKRLAKDLKGFAFEEFVAELFTTIGYKTRVTQKSGDKGVDVVAHRDELGIEPPIIKIQVKSTEGTVGDPEVSQLFGKVASGEFGVLVTLGSFSKQARDFAESKSNLRLIDGEELVRLTLKNYDALDPKYKGRIPLRKVYIPEGIGNGGALP
jgi:restriction system protein